MARSSGMAVISVLLSPTKACARVIPASQAQALTAWMWGSSPLQLPRSALPSMVIWPAGHLEACGEASGIVGLVGVSEHSGMREATRCVGPDAALKSRGNFCFFMVVRVEGLVVL